MDFNRETITQKFWECKSTNIDDAIDVAIKRAIHDFTFRTTEKTDDSYKGGEKALYELLCPNQGNSLLNEFKYYFNNDETWKEQSSFDKWHHDTCTIVLEALKNKYNVEYGKAQKIVNMTFKYLYCVLDAADEKFKYCHIPLDSIILDWIWAQKESMKNAYNKILQNENELMPKTLQHTCFDSWSNIKDSENQLVLIDRNNKKHYTYTFYQKLIRGYCSNKITPLQLEFLVWPQFQWERAANEFYKQTSRFLGEEKDINEFAPEDKIKKINELLKEKIALCEWSSIL